MFLALCTAVATALSLAHAEAPGTLERVRDAGRLRLGFRTDARPFSYVDASGNPSGYSVDLCKRIAAAVKDELHTPALTVEWTPIGAASEANRLLPVQQGTVDVLCAGDTITIDRRTRVAFSVPIFPGGISALVRADAPARLRDVLNGRGQTFSPTWRASASQVLQARAFSAVSGTTAETWLANRLSDLQVVTTTSAVPSYNAGLESLLARRTDALFGERAILLDLARRHTPAGQVVVLDRLFTNEPLALAVPRNDDMFLLLVDRTLTRLYASADLRTVYTNWFGEPDSNTLAFFRWNTLSN